MKREPLDVWVLFVRCDGGYEGRCCTVLPAGWQVRHHEDGSVGIQGLNGDARCELCGGELEAELKHVTTGVR